MRSIFEEWGYIFNFFSWFNNLERLYFGLLKARKPTCRLKQVPPGWVEPQPVGKEYWSNVAAPESGEQLHRLWWWEIHCLLDLLRIVSFLFCAVQLCMLYCYLNSEEILHFNMIYQNTQASDKVLFYKNVSANTQILDQISPSN